MAGTVGTPKKDPFAVFLAKLAQTGNVSAACRAAKIGRSSVYRRRDEDPEFAVAWEEALEEAADLLEEEAWRRAKTGVLKPVYQGGKKVGQIREYSDTLMIFLLKGARPEKYRDKVDVKQQVTGKDGGPVEHRLDFDALKNLPADELIRIHRETLGVSE